MDDFTSLPNVLRLGEPDAELAQILQPDREPASYPDIDIGRKNMLDRDKQAAIQMQTDSIVHSTKTIVMRDGHESEMRIFSPKNISAQDKAPLVVLYFGGGFMFGNNYQCANYATAISTLCSAVVVLPSYRLAPEHPFPIGPNDAWDSFVWIATNAAEEFHADPAIGFIVGGRSAGGTMAAVIAQKTLTENFTGPRITGTWLCMPMLLTERCVPDDERDLWVSRDQNQDAPFFNTAMIDVLLGNWKPDELSPLFSPFNAGPTRHRGLPTTYLQVCGMDPLRDDALLYERALRREGVHTILDVYSGVPHGVTTPFPQLKASRKFQIDIVVRIGQMLGHSLDRTTVEKVFRWL